jgi:hypothetical protein
MDEEEEEEEGEPEEEESKGRESKPRASKAGKDGRVSKDGKEGSKEVEQEEGTLLSQTRWTIPSGGAVQVVVKFRSADVGVFHEELAFEIVGGKRGVEVGARGRAVQVDPRLSSC